MDQPLFFEYVDHERARRFCTRCQDDGFTPGQTALLAAVNSWGLRGFVSNACADNRSLNVAKYWGRKVNAVVEKIRTPQDLLNFVADPLEAMAADWPVLQQLERVQRRMFFSAMGREWMLFADRLALPFDEITWDDALEGVTKSLTHMRINPTVLGPNVGMNDACRIAGLNSVSWNSWFYEDEDTMARQLVYMDNALSHLSGLPQGCLGVFGKVNLEVDTVGSEGPDGFFFMWHANSTQTPPTSTGIRLYSTGSWEVLCHEWIHSVDFVLGGSQGRLKMLSQTDADIQKLLMEHTTRFDASGQQCFDDLKSLEWGDAQRQHPYFQQMLRMPETVNNFFGDFIAQEETPYFQTYPERLAYMTEQAGIEFGLPRNDVFATGSAQNRTDAAELLTQFFQLPQVAQPLALAHRNYSKDLLKKGISQRRQKSRMECVAPPIV